MIVLDTNVISEIVRPQPDARVLSWLESLTDDVAITTITLAELLAGVRRLPEGRRKVELESALDDVLHLYRESPALLGFDDSSARAYAQIFVDREQAGLPISMADAQIAAICRSNDAICATRNTKDFRHTGVELINPWNA